MSFLSTVKPLLAGASEIHIHLSATDAGHRVMVTPKLAKAEPDTKDPELAYLQSVLAMPFIVNAPADADLDAVVVGAMEAYGRERTPVLDDLDTYRARVQAAAEAEKERKARAAAEKAEADKNKKLAKAGGAKPAPPAPKEPPAPDLFAPSAAETGGAPSTASAPNPAAEAAPTDGDDTDADTDENEGGDE